MLLALLVLSFGLSAQTTTMRSVAVTVTEPNHRFVTGLAQDHFDVFEDGVRRVITNFLPAESPIAIAIVGRVTIRMEGELIQTNSLPEALRQLAASKAPRKAVIITSSNADIESIPPGIQIVRSDAATAPKMIVELRTQYVLQFESPAPSSALQVVLKQPRGFPVLKANWN